MFGRSPVTNVSENSRKMLVYRLIQVHLLHSKEQGDMQLQHRCAVGGIVDGRTRYNQRLRGPLLLLAVVLLLNACSSPGAKPASNTTTNDAVIEAHSQRVLDDAIKAGAPGCSAAVGFKGKVVWTGVRGVANMATGDEITTDTVFDIGSVSKQFTATATLLLARAGKLTLDDPLSKHMSELPRWAATVTVAQLMHQTSGIPDYVGLLVSDGYQSGDRTTEDQALQALAAVKELEFQPDARFEYSNSNYLLLGEIVHRVSGEPLPQFLSAEIFHPLGLAMVMDPVAKIPNKAVSYTNDNDGYQVADSAWEQIGDGAIQTTPSQLVYWADNHRTGIVGGHELLDAQLSGAVETEPGGADRYGAGIFLMANGTLLHGGAWAGFVTSFRISRNRLTSLAISCNTDKQDPEALADSIGKLWM
jgi:CubicO group peptidase (beta-lactamase class C family)